MALNGRIVILGILEHAEQTRVIEAIEGVAGITGIDNFMLVPEAGYARRREGLR